MACGIVVVSMVCGGFAYAIGASGTPGLDEAQSAKQQSNVSARAEGQKIAFKAARTSAVKQGRRQGIRLGRRSGSQKGRQAGESEKAAQSAAAEPTTGYFGGCSEPLFVDGYCPTAGEIEAERNIEAYCGPGMKLPDGRMVPKPGC